MIEWEVYVAWCDECRSCSQ